MKLTKEQGKALAQHVNEYMKANGLGAKSFCKASGIATSALTRLRRGAAEVRNPVPAKLEKTLGKSFARLIANGSATSVIPLDAIPARSVSARRSSAPRRGGDERVALARELVALITRIIQ